MYLYGQDVVTEVIEFFNSISISDFHLTVDFQTMKFKIELRLLTFDLNDNNESVLSKSFDKERQ
jgi:hypothetical protein